MKNFKVHSKFLTSLNEALQKMAANDEIKIIKNPILEADGNFTSIIQSTNKFDPSKINSNVFADEVKENEELKDKKSELTDRILEKLKQTLDTNSELQSLLNQVKRLNLNSNENKWEVNEEDNTATLSSKNAYIFKQNDNLCLSHSGKVEIFKSVAELHDWLKKNHYPLPKNIKLHEAVDDHSFISKKFDTSNLSDFSKWQIERKNNIKKGILTDKNKKLDDLKKMLNYFLVKSDFNNNYYRTAYKKIEDNFADIQSNDEAYNSLVNDLKQLRVEFDKANTKELDDRRREGYGRWYDYSYGKKFDDFKNKVYDYVKPDITTNRSAHKMGAREYDRANFFGDFAANKTQDLHSFKTDDKATMKDLHQVKPKKEAQIENLWCLEYQDQEHNDKSYLAEFWNEGNLLTNNLNDAAKFISREEALETVKNVYNQYNTQFPFKPINDNLQDESLNECGVSTGTLGASVQYLGSKPKKESTFRERISKLIGKRLTDITLTEDDKPEDFAKNINADLNSVGADLNNQQNTDSTQSDMSSDDQAPDLDMGDGNKPAEFGDINISGGAGPMDDEYGPEEDEQGLPMEPVDEYKIIDILKNSKNPEELKVKTQNLTTNKIEIKDLSEIDI